MFSGFLHVCIFDASVVSKDTGSPFPTKTDKLNDTEGTINLIRAVHIARNQPIKLMRPDINEDYNITMNDEEESIVEVEYGGDPLRLIVDVSSAAVVTLPRNILINQPPNYYLSDTSSQELAVKCV